MINSNELKIIKNLIQEFFQKTGFEVELGSLVLGSTSAQDKNAVPADVVSVDVHAQEPQVLIGERGQALMEIQHLIRCVLRKKTDKQFLFELDINSYKKKKSEYLKELARLSAEEVILSKKEIVLPQMSAYERRVVHMELSNNENIITESIGENPNRGIAIRLKSGALAG